MHPCVWYCRVRAASGKREKRRHTTYMSNTWMIGWFLSFHPSWHLQEPEQSTWQLFATNPTTSWATAWGVRWTPRRTTRWVHRLKPILSVRVSLNGIHDRNIFKSVRIFSFRCCIFHTYPILKCYPTVMYVDRGHIRYRSYRDGRWNPRFVSVTAVLARGLRDAISILLGGLSGVKSLTLLIATFPLLLARR